MSKIIKKFRVNNNLTNMTTVKLSSEDGTYGIKRLDNLSVVVSDNTDMVNDSVGTYSYEFIDPELDLVYEFSIEYTYDGATYYIVEQFNGPTTQATIYTYSTIAEANALIANYLNTNCWDTATDNEKQKALSMATVAIDRLQYIYEKTNPLQENEFPRNGESTVPNDIKNACSLMAFDLISGIDPELERENIRLKKAEIGDIRSTYNTLLVPKHLMFGITSARVFRYLEPYLIDISSIRLHKV